MRPPAAPKRNVSGLIVWSVALVALMACTIRNPQPSTARPPSVQPANVPHAAWRPLHKGGVDLSTGVYVREDDDLVVDTPLPIVLRRTYNSLDGHPRQFGADTTHPGEWWIHGNSDP